MPFPRCKSNLYDSGTHVPLAIRWPRKIKAGRTVTDFVSLNDLAPTFLEAAGIKPPDAMTGATGQAHGNSPHGPGGFSPNQLPAKLNRPAPSHPAPRPPSSTGRASDS